MGFLSSLAGIALPIVGNMIAPGIGGTIGSALGSAISGGSGGSSQSGAQQTNQSGTQNGTQSGTQSGTQNTTQNGTQTTTLDPRIAQLLGTNGNGGLLSHLTGAMDTGSPIASAGQNFTGANAEQILNNGYATSNNLANNAYGTPRIQGAQVQAPSQNGMDLSGSYDRFINGTPGANPYLDKSIQGAIDQNRLGFQQLQDDSTKNLMQNIMPSIRSNSVLSGQYGGSRQGVAEGNAIGTQQTEMARAAAQFGQNATNAAVGAKAGAYETDSNRALSATQGLGAQQYGVAQQDALARQAADNTNVSSELSTNSLNAQKMAQGMQLQQGLLNSAQGYGNADLTRLGATAGILSPFLNAGATTTNNNTNNSTNNSTTNSTTNNVTTGNVSQPLYSNTAGTMIGGALAGSQLGNMFGGGTTDYNAVRNADGGGLLGSIGNLFGGQTGGTSVFNSPTNNSSYTPPQTVSIPSLPNLWG